MESNGPFPFQAISSLLLIWKQNKVCVVPSNFQSQGQRGLPLLSFVVSKNEDNNKPSYYRQYLHYQPTKTGCSQTPFVSRGVGIYIFFVFFCFLFLNFVMWGNLQDRDDDHFTRSTCYRTEESSHYFLYTSYHERSWSLYPNSLVTILHYTLLSYIISLSGDIHIHTFVCSYYTIVNVNVHGPSWLTTAREEKKKPNKICIIKIKVVVWLCYWFLMMWRWYVATIDNIIMERSRRHASSLQCFG